MKKKDWVIVAVVLVIAAISAIWLYGGVKESGSQVRIMIEGSEYGTYSLFEERVIEIANEHGYNRFIISQGKVFMEEADCPDGYCVEHKAIRHVKETIVCLPHKLVAEICGNEHDMDIDSITQ